LRAIEKIKEKLKQLQNDLKRKNAKYFIPAIWNGDYHSKDNISVNPFEYFFNRIELCENLKISKSNKTYNLLVRFTSSWDHNFETNSKKLKDIEFNNSGTFLKTIALLPYLRDLGISTIHLLPITSIGIANRKGDLGSPYAIKNHREIDQNLSEPFLELNIDTQYKAFIEIAHQMGFKVIQEFIFRTASIDSDLSIENPEWFYWIRGNTKMKESYDASGYGPPYFSERKLKQIKEKFEAGDFENSIAPDEKYRNYFTKNPVKVARVEHDVIGLLSSAKPQKSQEVKIAPAFSDWPPDDNQPVWSDVTYLKLYENAKFNYVAYNTVRAYDEELTQDINKVNSLWDYIINLLPYWIENFDIDGAMVDMGHALPPELLSKIIAKTREIKPEFIFLEENFIPNEKSKQTGYNAVMGYLMFDSHIQDKYKSLIRKIAHKELPIDIFLTPENHNTKRAQYHIKNPNYSVVCYAINSLLGNIHFIHSGYELLEKQPVNTGLGFTDEEIQELPAEKLALFSSSKLSWNGENIINDLIKINNSLKELNDIQNIEINENTPLIDFLVNSQIRIIANVSNDKIEIDNIQGYETNSIGNIEKYGNKLIFNGIGFILLKVS
jgi:glycosidase